MSTREADVTEAVLQGKCQSQCLLVPLTIDNGLKVDFDTYQVCFRLCPGHAQSSQRPSCLPSNQLKPFDESAFELIAWAL